MDLRNRLGIRQVRFAEMIGYEQSYVSALELGLKGPTNKEFLAKLIQTFTLDEPQQLALMNAVKESQQRFVLPRGVQADTFRMCSELWEKIDQLPPSQIQAIRALIRLNVPESDARKLSITQCDSRLEARM